MYQYLNGHLQYFPTAEGYVDHTKVQGSSVYNYIYQYKDHLGNIRMNYTFDAVNGDIKITEESHYYPFGLKPSNYNSEEYSFREFNAGIRLLGKPPVEDPISSRKTDMIINITGKNGRAVECDGLENR